MSKFKPGDKVVFVGETIPRIQLPPLKNGTVLTLQSLNSLWAHFGAVGWNVEGDYFPVSEKLIVHEEVYNSPLYKALL